ncbi:helix-turn-helix domain-containing protein [Pyxidicoccus sp. MSG2]|uniref:helix-turn-helix domain-containing protein n=1 Tax=Pyxidicoccus sp. MSG2 TaxID=2996790 RepID=UPI00227041B6|nr:AraC family transcriptional regulator [Pyxidicoccus sp. MSG2]MCY1018058.1 AraC family transcriptional regulator [Pyxidicoccus sp. MSG2]
MHLLAEDETFSAWDCVCHKGARSTVSEGEHPRVHISVTLAGVFHARSSRGEVLSSPGSLLLGNATDGYAYRHVDDGGDRSVVFDYAESFLDEVGGSLGVRLRDTRAFGRASIPASAASADAVVLAHRALCTGEPEVVREAALTVAAVALTEDRGGAYSVTAPTSAQERRVAKTLRYVEAHSADDCSLDTLAAHAGLSRFHFLRVFQAMTGQTPRQFVIATRLRMAATSLRATRTPITEVALEAGFGDLSHFTTSFARAFGVSPRAYRKRHGRGGD